MGRGRHGSSARHGRASGPRRGRADRAAPARAARHAGPAGEAPGADQEAAAGDRQAERRATEGARGRASARRDGGGRGAPEAAGDRAGPAPHAAGPRRGEQDLPVAVQSGDRADPRQRVLVQREGPRRLRVPRRRAGPLGLGRSLRARLRDHHGLAGRLRRGGSGDRDDVAALQPDAQRRSLLRGLRASVEVPRPRPAVREPAQCPRPVHRRRVAGRRGGAELPGPAAPVPDPHGGSVQQARRGERPGQQHDAA